MPSPTWVAVYSYAGNYEFTVRCHTPQEVEATIYHNKYYGYHCFKISVKTWKD